MPWKEQTIKMERREFVERALSGLESKASLCRAFGISRPTGDKWIRRMLETGDLSDHDRTPIRQPRRTDPEMEGRIIDLRLEYPFLGARKLHRLLTDSLGSGVPSPSTINAILTRNGLITPEASAGATPFKRFVMSEPNDMWQCDYKGHFPMQNGLECHPLNIIDDHSRHAMCSRAMLNETFDSFQPVLIELFQTYGMPKYFLCDNGNPWGNGQRQGFSRVDVWLMQLSVLPIHGRLHHPQTQGKEESFNRALNRECIQRHLFADQQDAQAQFDAYRLFYNTVRPHHALDLDTPAQHYKKSSRVYPGVIEPWTYPSGRKVMHVHGKGHFRYKGHDYYLGDAFGGENIALRDSAKPGRIAIEYREFRIGRINVDEQKLENRRAWLLRDDPRSK